ncbi:MAG: type II secretion system F family protein [Bifidobacteriaceae bacterium]|jgi:tight adherence protein B|nr:type II secretion system F family protein [Bifidobacteriaceae bacterium]
MSPMTDARAAALTVEDLIAALHEVAALLRAGLTGAAAWSPVTGADGLAAWRARAATSPVAPYAAAVLAVRELGERVGASTGDLLDSLAAVLAERQDAADRRAAALAGPKATARVLTVLPLLGLGLGAAIGAHPIAVLTGGGLGTAAGIAGLVLIGIGHWWTRRLLRRAQGADPTSALIAVEILSAALSTGLPIAEALATAGRLAEGPEAARFGAVAGRLAAGQTWDAAWSGAAAGPVLEGVERALGLAWDSGVSAGPLLAGVSARLRRAARRRDGIAVGRLGVRLMAPLGVCFLPAFVALGLLPVILSLAGELIPTL